MMVLGLLSDFLQTTFVGIVDALRKESRSMALSEVEYDEKKHEARLQDTYGEINKCISKGAFARPMYGLLNARSDEEIEIEKAAHAEAHKELFMGLLPLVGEMYRLKSIAFAEEKEWRVLSYVVKSEEKPIDYAHRVSRNRIIPFRSIGLRELERSPIAEVMLGPRHETPMEGVAKFLQLQGYGEIPVRRSAASYR